jgi:RNA polymerase sigma-B factor
LQERAAKVNKAIEALSKQTGRSPSVKEIATKLGLDLEQVLEALEAAQAFDAASLEAERAGADGSPMRLGDTVGEVEPGFELVEYGASIDPVLAGMPHRTRRILHLRFVEDMTQAQIAEEVGVSQMHVSRIIREALTELREAVAETEVDG